MLPGRWIPVTPRCGIGIGLVRFIAFTVVVECGYAIFDNCCTDYPSKSAWNRVAWANASALIEIGTLKPAMEQLKVFLGRGSHIKPVFGRPQNLTPTDRRGSGR